MFISFHLFVLVHSYRLWLISYFCFFHISRRSWVSDFCFSYIRKQETIQLIQPRWFCILNSRVFRVGAYFDGFFWTIFCFFFSLFVHIIVTGKGQVLPSLTRSEILGRHYIRFKTSTNKLTTKTVAKINFLFLTFDETFCLDY